MPSSSQKEFYHSATMQYAAALRESSAAASYLRKRGLSEASAASFRLGVVANPLTGHEQYAGRLVVPYLTRYGVCGASFRCIAHESCKDIHNDKYQWPSGFARRMFNPLALDIPSPVIAICEGEIDTITAQQCGIPAVGVPGVKSWQSFWARCFKGYETVFVLADNDDSGEGEGLARKIESQVSSARTVKMPDGHDVNSFVMEHGEDALRARLGISTP